MAHFSWLKPRLHFSLRVAALGLTALCVWMGLLARSALRQQTAVAELVRLGASVAYDNRDEEMWAPLWLREFVGNDFFVNVNYVQFSHRTIERRVHHLTSKDWEAAVAAIGKLPRVRYIYFGYCDMSDEDLRKFAPVGGQIEELWFNDSRFSPLTGAALAELSSWPKLASLGMPHGLRDLQSLDTLANFPALTTLTWSDESSRSLDENAFAALARCKRLEHLTLFMCRFSGEALARLRKAPALKTISLHNTKAVFVGGSRRVVAVEEQSAEDATIGATWPDAEAPDEFEFVPESGMEPWDPNAPPFPEQRYRDWIKRILPGVEVWEMSSS
jgi:hypothetical protein